jgi:hypothetical protein
MTKPLSLAVGLFAAALLTRLVIFGIAMTADPTLPFDDDSAGYVTLADTMRAGHGFSWSTTAPYAPNSFRTPGYPAFILVHEVAFGTPVAALVTQVFLSVLIGWIVLLIGRRYFTPLIAFAGTGIFLFMPFSLIVPERYLTQVPFTLVVMCAVWAFLQYMHDDTKKYLIGAALAVPIAALIRPIAMLLVAPFIAILLFAAFTKQIAWQRALAASAVFIAVFAVGVAPWVLRNQHVFGRAALSSLVPSQLYFYDDPAIYATTHHVSYQDAHQALVQRIESVTQVPVTDYEPYMQFSPITDALIAEGKKVAFESPTALALTRLEEFFKFFVRDGIRYVLERYGVDTAHGPGFLAVVVERLTLAVLMIGFFYSSVRALLSTNIPVLAMSCVVLYFAVLTGVMASAGLRYPAEPLFILLGVAGVAELVTLVRKRRAV